MDGGGWDRSDELKETIREMWRAIPPWEVLRYPEVYSAMMSKISKLVTDARVFPVNQKEPAGDE